MKKKSVVSAALVSFAMVMAFAASAQATSYSDALNINFSNGGTGDVSGTIYTTQSPAALGGNWANVDVTASGGNTGWDTQTFAWNGVAQPTTIHTSNGTAVAVGGSSNFYVGVYAEDYWNASAGVSSDNGGNLGNTYWWGQSGSGGVDLWANNVPFASYEVYYLSREGNWSQVGGTYTSPSTGFVKIAGSWNSATVAAIQILETGGTPPTPNLTTSLADGTPISLTSPTSTTLTLGNSGGGTITGTAGVTGGDASLFTVTPGTVNLGAAGTQDYTVSFIGTAVGTFGTTLSILTDAGNLSYALSATVAPPAWPNYIPGDFNKDGQVGPEDFGILKDQFGTSNLAHGNHESWTLGDANDDGQIGPEDFGLLKDNFGSSNGPTGTYPLANVPEPTTLALLALAGLAIRRKQR